MRTLVTLGSGTLASGASASIPFTALPHLLGGRVANLSRILIRLAKGTASTVRPYTATIRIRDGRELMFDGTGSELLAEMREAGRAVQALLGATSSADECLLEFRPGVGADDSDRQHATPLWVGGSVEIQAPTDAGQTTAYQVVAEVRGADEARIAASARTRTFASTSEIAQAGLLARLRDTAHASGNSYTVESGGVPLLAAVLGGVIAQSYESVVGNSSDPATTGTAAAHSTLAAPCIVRAAHGTPEPLVTKLLEVRGAVALTGFAGNPLATVVAARERESVQAMVEQIATVTGRRPLAPVIKTRFDAPWKGGPRAKYMPLAVKFG